MRTNEVLEDTNWYLNSGEVTDRRLIRLLTLLKINFNNSKEVKALFKKRVAELCSTQAKLKTAQAEAATLTTRCTALVRDNNKLRRALLILAGKTSDLDPAKAAATDLRDWAIEEAKKVS